jgi:hypothetical protein
VGVPVGPDAWFVAAEKLGELVPLLEAVCEDATPARHHLRGARVTAAGRWSGTQLLGPARAELAMIVLANVLVEPPLLAVRVLAPREGLLVGSSAAPLGAERLADAVEARAAALLDEAGFRRASWLRVEVSPPDAALSIDGVPEATRAGRFSVPPGVYVARAHKDGFGVVEARVNVPPGGEAEVRLSLAEETSLLASPWFWTALVGAALVSGAVAVYAGSRGNQCVCLGGPTQSCPPQGARAS